MPFDKAGRHFVLIDSGRSPTYMILALILLLAAPAETLTSKVTAITDGDSIKVLHDRTEVTIRLAGIDCPESGQAFGQQAKKQTSDLSFGKTVTVQAKGKDRYGRTLAGVVTCSSTLENPKLILPVSWSAN